MGGAFRRGRRTGRYWERGVGNVLVLSSLQKFLRLRVRWTADGRAGLFGGEKNREDRRRLHTLHVPSVLQFTLP